MSPRVPDFFMVGASRSGTTTLADLLRQHPRIKMPYKEPAFLSDLGNPRFPDLASYLAIYADCAADAVVVDASTAYLPSEESARRIHALNPSARIGMTLRNPVDRAYSLYWAKVRSLQDPLSFEDALAAEADRIRDGHTFGWHYATSGLYTDQVQRYLDVFGRERVRIHLFDDYVRDPLRVARDLFSFLGLDHDLPIQESRLRNHSGPARSRVVGRILSGPFPGRRLIKRVVRSSLQPVKRHLHELNSRRAPAIEPATRARLIEWFGPDIERLEQLIGRDLSAWRGEPAVTSPVTLMAEDDH